MNSKIKWILIFINVVHVKHQFFSFRNFKWFFVYWRLIGVSSVNWSMGVIVSIRSMLHNDQMQLNFKIGFKTEYNQPYLFNFVIKFALDVQIFSIYYFGLSPRLCLPSLLIAQFRCGHFPSIPFQSHMSIDKIVKVFFVDDTKYRKKEMEWENRRKKYTKIIWSNRAKWIRVDSTASSISLLIQIHSNSLKIFCFV